MKKFKYVEIAENIETLISSYALKPGDKLQSIRTLSKERGISASTAFQVYYLLESKGLIRARPKSGYYVKTSPKKQIKDISLSTFRQCKISSLSDLTAGILEMIHKEEDPLSLIQPSVDLLPIAKLKKSAKITIQASPSGWCQYGSIAGEIEARQEISKFVLNSQTLARPDEIILTNGCYEGIYLALSTLTKPGDVVAVESPIVFGILQMIDSMGCKILEIPSNPRTGMCLSTLKENLRLHKVKACVSVPNFNNPTGSLMPDSKKQRFVEILSDYNIPLIEDDIFGDIYFGRSRPRTCKSFDKSGNVILCSSFCKILAPGYRVGWIIPGKFFNQILKIKSNRSMFGNTLNQQIIAHFLKTGRFDFHLRTFRNKVYKQYNYMLGLVVKYFPENIKISQPQGGFSLWVELDPAVDTTAFSMSLLKQKISILPGEAFSSSNYYKNYFRLSYSSKITHELKKKLIRIGKQAMIQVPHKSF
ncbi:MAG: PLP-dependent aminotransferase family protein [Desulfobacteraceae bacterium]|nr:PLP-dependent aminotransferase family protein [Desulfobacteraceae bacterium]